MKYYNFIFLSMLLISSSVISQVIPENPELLKIRTEINKMITDSIIPSMAVAVIQYGKIIWQEAIGYADIEKKEKATLQSAYPLGSVSKSITATSIMHMINTGEVDLFDDVRPFISSIKLKNINGDSPEIKLWQLVSQNGGLNHGYGVFEKEVLPKTQEEVKQFYESSTIVAYTPGEVYHYSNHSFDAAELVIEKKSGDSFQNYMNKNVFYPLKMKNTYAYPQLSDATNFVSTYSSKLNKLSAKNIIYPAGGAGFWSSIQDMTQYILFHMGELKDENIISSENLKLMHEFRQGPADMFGIGWFNSDGNLYSNGNVDGGNAVISIDKKNNLTVICLLNKTSNDGIADQTAGKISNTFFKKEDNSFKEYRRIYATPYTKRLDLLGTWKGILKDPVSLKEIPISLLFDNEGKITFQTGEQSVPLNYAGYNLMQELKGKINIRLPEIFGKMTECSMTLSRNKNKFTGYMFYGKNLEKSFYTMPLFVEVIKEK